ncbi:MAG: hypothetical protein OXE55_00245 [Flavobacteriaceae bacterium]|nr:hypothetical protein [Flavobacteriaceae bacterium]
MDDQKLIAELRKINQKLDSIVSFIYKWQEKITNNKHYIKKEIKSNSDKSTISSSLKKTEKQAKQLFFSMPESDGVFINSEASHQDIDGDKFYKIELQNDSETRGLLFYHSNFRDVKAINRSQSYLDPVCKIENYSYKQDSKKIKTTKPAEIELIEGTWRLKNNQRVLVRFI